ncbi:MAG: hypothetical protein U0168_07090 [Nannocystaceae bacterium]
MEAVHQREQQLGPRVAALDCKAAQAQPRHRAEVALQHAVVGVVRARLGLARIELEAPGLEALLAGGRVHARDDRCDLALESPRQLARPRPGHGRCALAAVVHLRVGVARHDLVGAIVGRGLVEQAQRDCPPQRGVVGRAARRGRGRTALLRRGLLHQLLQRGAQLGHQVLALEPTQHHVRSTGAREIDGEIDGDVAREAHVVVALVDLEQVLGLGARVR